MNRFLQIFNFLGICALAILCCFQWSANRREHQRITALQTANQEHLATINQQAQTIRGQQSDLDDFRHRLTRAHADLSDTQEKLAGMTAERDRLQTEQTELIAQRDQLKASLNKWVAAVAARDALIKQASSEITQLAKQRNDAIQKFNDLAARYNTLVKQIAPPAH